MFRSTEIGDLRIAAQVNIAEISKSVKTLIEVQPNYNNELTRQLGFKSAQQSGWVTWAITKNDPNIAKTYIGDDLKKDIMLNDDIVNGFQALQLTRQEATDHAYRDAQTGMAGFCEVVKTFVSAHPSKANNAQIAAELGCKFADADGMHSGMVTHFALGKLEEAGAIRRDAKVGSKVFYKIVDPNAQYKSQAVADVRGDKYNMSLGEARAAHYLNTLQQYGITYEFQARFEKCINPETGRVLPFDFKIMHEDIDGGFILLEIDGAQHRRYIEYFHGDPEGFRKQQERDKIKERYCNDSDIILIRINDDDDIRDLIHQELSNHVVKLA